MNTDPNIRNHDPVVRTSTFRFYEELNDFLPAEHRKKSFLFHFTGTPSVKNTIEAIGIPHPEIDLILVDGNSVTFDFLLKGGETISVYPVFESLDISPIIKLRPEPLRITKFIVDVNLGKLARKLRLLGFDTLFRNNLEDNEIVNIAAHEKRIILTRDKGVLKHNEVTHGFWLRSDNPTVQLTEVVQRLQLQSSFDPFSRCSNCNGSLESKDKSAIEKKVSKDTLKIFNEFWQCIGCNNIYWKGSHYDKICGWVNKLKL